jgi:hypothetical protein
MRKKENDPLENLLAWSQHRIRLLGQCEVRYYHQYLGSWGGWDTSSPPEAQAAYHSKYLTTPALEIGQIVHGRIRVVLEQRMAGHPVEPDIAIKIAQAQFESFVDASRRRDIAEVSQKRRKFLLHQLGGEISAAELAGYLQRIEELLRAFFGFDEVKMILNQPEGLLSALLDPLAFEVGYELGVPSRPRTDAVYVNPEKILIADWKCGEPQDADRQQAITYDIFVRRRLDLLPTESTQVTLFYLGAGERITHWFTDDERAERLWQIGEEFETLRQRSDDPRINVAPESRFRPSVTRACLYCNFRLMCEPFLRSSLAVEGRTP